MLIWKLLRNLHSWFWITSRASYKVPFKFRGSHKNIGTSRLLYRGWEIWSLGVEKGWWMWRLRKKKMKDVVTFLLHIKRFWGVLWSWLKEIVGKKCFWYVFFFLVNWMFWSTNCTYFCPTHRKYDLQISLLFNLFNDTKWKSGITELES
jgi:hypothetical protein